MLERHTIRRYAKAGVLAVALVVLAGEGYFVYQWYDRYHGHDAAASDAGSAANPEPAAGTKSETARDTKGAGPAGETAFVHRATEENSRGDYTYLGHPGIDGDPEAVILAEPNPEAGNAREGDYGHNVGVWYEPSARRWAVFNQDRAPVAAGAAFKVVVPRRSDGFVHRAAPPNTVGNSTYLDDPLTNGAPDTVLSVAQNWNPGGGEGVYNDHLVGVRYDEEAERWTVYNRDGAPMPAGAAFNVAVSRA